MKISKMKPKRLVKLRDYVTTLQAASDVWFDAIYYCNNDEAEFKVYFCLNIDRFIKVVGDSVYYECGGEWKFMYSHMNPVDSCLKVVDTKTYI